MAEMVPLVKILGYIYICRGSLGGFRRPENYVHLSLPLQNIFTEGGGGCNYLGYMINFTMYFNIFSLLQVRKIMNSVYKLYSIYGEFDHVW